MLVTPAARTNALSIYVEGFLETMMERAVMRRHGNATRNAALKN